ncbi:MAG: UPF0262 family protein [Kordiimonadaceae bacterium]|jgi:uncharacterized protein (UPF0262 family)|nr:UPF0262 family protein [Kordiimonadaceae bacterium]MBT6036161.1 UPF0262 family protein [Kordiimonadaceae bacterium]MBT6330747.1 UPF0262 family protein [Kordiimonadaceae bacterium]MBT7581827.1 UPF0262 family protein [Kordiimonadaceae bacterium]
MEEERRTQRICHIELDDKTIIRRNDDIENERKVAIYDLLENNRFVPQTAMPDDYKGPYHVTLRMEDNRLAIDLRTEQKQDLSTIVLPLSPLRSIIKQYFLICDSYYTAIKKSGARHVEAIDLGRRALHDEGSELMISRFSEKIEIDFETARRLFTLICVLQIR